MADEIEVIPPSAASENYEAAAPPAASTAAGDATEAPSNGPVAQAINNLGISINRNSTALNGNGSNGHGNGTNGHANGANGYSNGANGHAANGNGSNGHNGNGNGANGNGANGNGANGHSNGNGSQSNGDSYRNEPPLISRSFAPPQWASHCVHLYIPEHTASAETLSRLWNICRSHHGETEVWLHIDNGQEMMQLRVAPAFWVDASSEFFDQALSVLGEGHVLVPQ